MKNVEIELKSVSPLLINRFKEQDELPASVKKGKKDYGTPRSQAESTAYQDEGTQLLWIPSTWIKGAIQTIASDYKLPGTRKSLKSVSGGAIFAEEEKLFFSEKYKVKDIEIDSRPCVIQRARIMRHRARLESWTLKFTLSIEEEIISPEILNDLLVDAGKRSGLGDFRPSKGGPFGRFLVSSFKLLKK